MKILGVTGGVGSGKSRILDYLGDAYGAVVVQLDETARQLQRKGESCYEEIVRQFGDCVVGADGELDRKALGAIVFQDEEKLKRLNAIVHPAVKRSVEQDISEKKKSGVSLYVIEAALLPTAGYTEICDEMWYIYVEKPVRMKRLAEARGYSEAQTEAMIASQPAEEIFRSVCSAVIDNSGDFENTKRQIGELLL